jgi:hypothetical protein
VVRQGERKSQVSNPVRLQEQGALVIRLQGSPRSPIQQNKTGRLVLVGAWDSYFQDIKGMEFLQTNFY